MIRLFTEFHFTTSQRPGRCLRGRPTGYERALGSAKPVNPIADKAGVVMGYADLIDSNYPQLFVTLTCRPEKDRHGRPVFMSESKARYLRDKVLHEIAREQGYKPDYICFHERQRNTNHHYHLAMSNVNLSLQAFQPIKERCDKRGLPHLCLRGLERKANEIMGRANFRVWGCNGFTAADYFAKDMLKQDKDGGGVEFSPLYGKRKRRVDDIPPSQITA